MNKAPVLLLARLLAGGVLAASGVLKAAAPAEEFAVVIEAYGLIQSQQTIMQLAAVLPWAEALAGIALLYGVFTRAAAAVCGGLYLTFLFAIGTALSRGIPLTDCGCFGMGFHFDPKKTLAMDVLLLGCALAVFLAKRHPLSLDNWASRGYTARK